MNTEKNFKKTIIITGGAGYIGSIVTKTLLQNNYKVICIDNLRYGDKGIINLYTNPNFTFKNIDITNHDVITNIFDETKDCYAVIHLAAIVGDPACKLEPVLAENINLTSSINLLEKSVQSSIEKFIFASTCSNYGKMTNRYGYVDETTPLAPLSLYSELKVKVENYILNEITKSEGFSPTCLRFATVFGISPRMRFDLTVNEFTKEIAMGNKLVVFGEQFWRPYCHVTDFSSAILNVLSQPKEKTAYQVYNVGNTQENYTKQMIVEYLKKLEPNLNVEYVSKNEDPRDYKVNFDKINKELGFRISKTVFQGMSEIFFKVRNGYFGNVNDQIYYNTPYNSES